MPKIQIFESFDSSTSTFDIWSTDGTANGTIDLGAAPTPALAGSNHFYSVGDFAYISSVGGTGAFIVPGGIYITNGSVGGSIPSSQLNGLDAIENGAFVGLGDVALFDGISQTGSPDGLWVANGETGTLTQISQQSFGFVGQLGGEELLSDGSGNLWVTNGTATGTVQVATIGATQFHWSTQITANQMALLADDPNNANASDLWITDGTAAGTKEIVAGLPLASGANVAFGGKVLFDAADSSSSVGVGLWVTDGTAAGTKELASAQEFHTSSAEGLAPSDFTVLGNGVLFAAGDSSVGTSTVGSGLWETDGTSVQELVGSQQGSHFLNPYDITALPQPGDLAAFAGTDSSGDQGLWIANGQAGTAQELVAGSQQGHNLAPSQLTALGSEVLFTGIDSSGDVGLWVTNGASATEIGQFAGIGEITALGGEAVFEATPLGASAADLFVTDGTAAGTQEIASGNFTFDGGVVIPGVEDVWTGNGDWNLNPQNWSLGAAPTSQDAEIAGTITLGALGAPQASGAAASLLVDTKATFSMVGANSSLTLAGDFTNNGATTFADPNSADAQDQTVGIGGAFINSGSVTIGASNMAGVVKVTAATFQNFQNGGALDLQGNADDSTQDITGQAILDIAGAPNSSLQTGGITVSGDANLEFGSGGITDISVNSTLASTAPSLTLNGALAEITTNGGATSALSGLTSNEGVITLTGDGPQGAGGVTLATTTSFENHNTLNIDDALILNPDGSIKSSCGGSTITFGGKLINESSANGSQIALITIGNVNLAATTMVSAMDLENDGSIVLQGQAAADPDQSHEAILNIAGSAVQALGRNASIRVSGDADLQFGNGGQINDIAAGDTLELDGAQAQITTMVNGIATSALTFLAGNQGTLLLESGRTDLGVGTVVLNVDDVFQNSGVFKVDDLGSNTGGAGASVTFEQLQNLTGGTIFIGNPFPKEVGTTVESDGGLFNNGSLTLVDAELLVKNGDAENTGALVLNTGSELDATAGNSFVQTAGTTTIGNATLAAARVLIEGGIMTVTGGTLHAQSLDVSGGKVDFTDAVGASNLTGAINLGGSPQAGATLEFDSSASGHPINFDGAGTLLLGDAAGFQDTIVGFGADDLIVLAGITFAAGDHMVWQTTANGVQTFALEDAGNNMLATLDFAGHYSADIFAVASDNSGHAQITLNRAPTPVADTSDFNGDGLGDLIWQNGTIFTEWQSSGNSFTPNVDVGSVGAGWTLAGTGDFNGDGRADLIWQNGTTFTEWQSTGNSFTQNVDVGSVGAGWTLAGVGDFNGDGMADLIWQNGTTFSEWQSTGNAFTQNVDVGSVGAGWNIAAVGDFNGDGKADLIWQNGTTFTEWQSTGNGFTQNVDVGSVGAGWNIVGTGDFNGDGKTDLIWENGGAFSEWQSTGNGFTQNTYIGSLGAGWSVAAIGDFNGDGMSDILFRNTNGTFTEWQSTGTGFTQNVLVNSSVGTAWSLEYSPSKTSA